MIDPRNQKAEFADRRRIAAAPADLNFAHSPALFPDESTRQALSREYGRDRDLFFGEAPSFGEILTRLLAVRSALVR